MLQTDTLVVAAFMAVGMFENKNNVNIALKKWDGGCYELVQQVVSFAPYTVALADAGIAYIVDGCGLYEYDVAEGFGAWYVERIIEIGEAVTVPSWDECIERLKDLVLEFFKEGPDSSVRNEAYWDGLALLLEDVKFEFPEGFTPNQYASEA